MKKKQNKEYRTYQFRINKSNNLFEYCDTMCFNSKNLYNVANFYIRQAYSGLSKTDEAKLHDNEKLVIETINENIDTLNKIKQETFEKRKNYKNKKQKDAPSFYKRLDKENSFLNIYLIDSLFRLIEQQDYVSLPSQTNFHTLKLLGQDWKSFFESIKDYKVNPSKYKGKPKPPRYAKKDGRKPAIFTNQSCKIKEDDGKYYLIFPKTKKVLNLGELKITNVQEVRIVPNSNFYTIEIVTEVPKTETKNIKSKRIGAIDLGVENLVTISNNVGVRPIIVKGTVLKARNQYYNKKRAYYYSILRHGKSPKERQFTSKRLNKLDTDRYYFIKDYFHKTSKIIVNYCITNQLDTLVIGKNKGWKDDVTMHKKDKQNFIGIPYNMLINMIIYKAEEAGIKVIVTEESYTSKASFLDNDYIPTYGVDDKNAKFSGKRIKRGLYKSKDGTLINADLNGSLNILRKVFPNAFTGKKDSGIVDVPIALSVA